MLPRLVLLLAALLSPLAAFGEEPKATVRPDHVERAKAGTALFKSSVREILVKECLECHGGKSVKADFDLSTREKLVESGMLEETAADSHLFAVVAHTADPHMPLKKDKLSDEKLAAIKKWIDLGAPYDKPLIEGKTAAPAAMIVTDSDRKFWSFQPLAQPAIPEVKNAAWPRTAIDRFVIAAQEAKGLSPNQPAARRTLIRRAYFDLLGLPPKPEEVEAFVSDVDPQAYEKLIDRLLESEHYGERWARHWMDIARYAESHGYEQDYDRNTAYHYRNFLIKAFNADMPFNQFIQWQLAGDELAPGDPLALMATGFIGAGAFPTQLTETEFESARYDELDDMVATTGVAFLGLSVGCARCHDHKFDPIPVRDYYRMASAFTTAIRTEVEMDLEPEANRQRYDDFIARQDQLKAALQQYEVESLPGEFKTWLGSYDPQSQNTAEPWQPLRDVSAKSDAGTTFTLQGDGSFLASGAVPNKEVITITGETKSTGLLAVRLEALKHDSLPQKGPGRAGNGNFVVSQITVTAAPLKEGPEAAPVKLVSARATHEQNKGDLSVAASLDPAEGTGWAVDVGGIGADQAAVFDFEGPVGFPEGTRVTITLKMHHPNPTHTLGHFRVSLTGLSKPEAKVGGAMLDPKIVDALAAVKQNPDPASENWKIGQGWFAPRSAEWAKRSQALNEHNAKGPQLQKTKILITSEGLPHLPHHADDRGFPHFYPETFFLKRGDVNQKDGQAPLGFLQVLMPAGVESDHWKAAPPEGARTSFRRASLANWMTDPNSGGGALAARVIVNRLWQHHFGRGLVATPNDFGIQGERPTHPELLEWLANDLVSNGWKLKRLHKLIMTSNVYLQDGTFDEKRATIDRENTLLWRRAPMRLEAEPIRDAMLAVSGLLDPAMYAPGTLDANMRRRSVYFQIKRSGLIPTMMLFDWPEHLVSIGQRPTTTIAPQALMFLNSTQGRQCSEAFGQAMTKETPEATVDRGYELALGRKPTEKERTVAVAFFRQQSDQYRTAGKPDPDRLARIDLAQAILSLNEFVYID
jgi:mono/diheme cytochrome c family protein